MVVEFEIIGEKVHSGLSTDYMSLIRFQQILHYFHISDPSVMHEDDENDE